MADRAIGARHAIRPRQHAAGHHRDARGVGAHIGAVVVVDHVVDGEDLALRRCRRRGSGGAGCANGWRRSGARGGPRSISPAGRAASPRRRPARPRDRARRGCRSRRRHATRSTAPTTAAGRACARSAPCSGAAPWRRRAAPARRARRRSGRARRASPAARRNAGPMVSFELDDVRRGREHRLDVAVALVQHRRPRCRGRARTRRARLARVEQRRQLLDLHRRPDRRRPRRRRGPRRTPRRPARRRSAPCRSPAPAGGRARASRSAPRGNRSAPMSAMSCRGPHRDHAGQRARRAGVDRDDAGRARGWSAPSACEAGAGS